jgi:glucose dehydrogenase
MSIPATMWAGTVSTAGGIVFTGDGDGNLVALDARTCKDLWRLHRPPVVCVANDVSSERAGST